MKMGTPRMSKANQKLIALFGPTGVGKTAVAVEIAQILAEQDLRAVAVCADSMQIYAGMSALTGAPTATEQAKLEHRLLGYVDPSREFSAGEFQAEAHAEIDQLLAEGCVPIVVGGTGFYLQAALTDLDLKDPVAPQVRAKLESKLATEGPESLHAELVNLNPIRAAQIDCSDGRRTVRALELILSGVDPSSPANQQLWTARLRHPTPTARSACPTAWARNTRSGKRR